MIIALFSSCIGKSLGAPLRTDDIGHELIPPVDPTKAMDTVVPVFVVTILKTKSTLLSYLANLEGFIYRISEGNKQDPKILFKSRS